MNKLLASVAAAAILMSTAAFAEPEGTTSDATTEAAPAKGDAAPAMKTHKGKHKAHKKSHKKMMKKDDAAK